jgi:hypothetical protein
LDRIKNYSQKDKRLLSRKQKKKSLGKDRQRSHSQEEVEREEPL